jgi:outer membrane lipopolysaccharide assembly protein LptE/RlpB
MKRSTMLAALSLALVVSGCGYHVVGRDDALPKTIHVIAIPAFENKTSSYRIEQKLTAATIREFLESTRYKIVSNPAAGDAVLRAKVLSLEATPLLFITTPATSTTPSTTRATTMLVTMKCDVTLTDSATQKVLFHNDNFLFRNEYEIASGSNANTQTGVEEFFEEQDPALDRMASDFAQRLVANVTENF